MTMGRATITIYSTHITTGNLHTQLNYPVYVYMTKLPKLGTQQLLSIAKLIQFMSSGLFDPSALHFQPRVAIINTFHATDIF